MYVRNALAYKAFRRESKLRSTHVCPTINRCTWGDTSGVTFKNKNPSPVRPNLRRFNLTKPIAVHCGRHAVLRVHARARHAYTENALHLPLGAHTQQPPPPPGKCRGRGREPVARVTDRFGQSPTACANNEPPGQGGEPKYSIGIEPPHPPSETTFSDQVPPHTHSTKNLKFDMDRARAMRNFFSSSLIRLNCLQFVVYIIHVICALAPNSWRRLC